MVKKLMEINTVKASANKLVPHVYLGFAFFLILNAPSIKNFFPSEAVNIVPLFMFMLYIFLIRRFNFNIDKDIKLYILLVSIFFIYLLTYGLFHSMESFSTKFLIKYIVIMMTMIFAALLVTRKSIEVFVVIGLFWATFMAFAVITKGISLTNINYLQIGHPIASGVIISGVYLIKKGDTVFSKLLYLFLLLFFFSALSNLYGRSPLLFPVIVIFMLAILYIYTKNKFYFIVATTSFIGIAYLIYEWFLTILPKHIADRLLRMIEDPDEEPRLQLWERSFDYILQNPMGYGLESSWHLVGYTPHNFMIETLLSSGIIGLLPFVLLLFLWFSLGLKSYRLNHTAVAVFGISLYYFLRYQIGGAIGSSYDFFIVLLLSISYIRFKVKEKNDFNNNPNTQP